MMRYVAKSTVARLNSMARTEARRNGGDVVVALSTAAMRMGLTEVRRADDTILYRNKHGAHVNCWLEGPMSQDIVDGGAGFDDNIDWAFMTTDD